MLHKDRMIRGRCHLALEALEPRWLPSGYPPTAVEQQFLEQLNDGRANPAAYGASIGLDLSTVAPSQPLAFDTRLIQTARDHSTDMNNQNYFGHNSPQGLDPGQRMTAAGYPWTAWAESIAAGYTTTADALKGLIIDQGVSDLGHRKQLLSIGSPYNLLNQVGIGVLQNGSGSYSNYYTIDGGATADGRPFLTGVVLNDINHNAQYDLGEGLANVTLTVAGVGSTTSFTSGGYSFQLSPGTYSVTASGGGLAGPITQTVTLGAANIRLNFFYQNVIIPLSGPVIATGADAGGGPDVRVFNSQTGVLLRDFFAYDAGFRGGVRVAVGDVNGDGIPDIITAPGPTGGPDVRIWDGKTGALIRELLPYSPAFTGGINVAAADVNGDGFADYITGADAGGGPHVQVFSGKDGALLMSFFAYDLGFRGGVRVAAGDVNGDGRADIVTAPGIGGGPDVRVFSGATGAMIQEVMAYNPAFTGGVYVAAGDVNGDGKADIITGAGAGGGPHVEVFGGMTNVLLESMLVYNSSFTGGVRVAALDVNGDGHVDVVTGAGPGGGPHVQVFDGRNFAVLDSLFAYDLSFSGGVFVVGH